MKPLKSILSITLFVVGLVTMGISQPKSLAQKGDDAFSQMRYAEAIVIYEKALDKVKSNRAEKSRIMYQMAECNRLIKQYPKAIGIYKRLVRSKYYTEEPKVYFHLAECYRFMNEFDLAGEQYEEYLKLVPNDDFAKSRKASMIVANEFMANRTRHVIYPMTIKSNSEQNDWSPTFKGDDTLNIVFSSSRFDFLGNSSDVVDAWSGEQAFSDLLLLNQDSRGNWDDVALFDDGLINTMANEGEAVFSPDGSRIYFSRCKSEPNKKIPCKIYTAKKKGSIVSTSKTKKKAPPQEPMDSEEEVIMGDWEDISIVNLGDSVYDYLHPAISRDGLTIIYSTNIGKNLEDTEEALDFDLWIATRSSENLPFENPRSLGDVINTKGREAFPSLRNDSILYFSSTGHAGLGGLDIFSTRVKSDGTWEKPFNLGCPMNSSYDDIGILFYPDNSNPAVLERGFISSNRPTADPHGKIIDEKIKRNKQKPLNYDLWYFELPPLLFSIEGTVRDEKSMQLMPNAKVRIVGSDGSQFVEYTDKKGFYRFGTDKIKIDVVYKMFVSKVDYFSTEGSESTKGYTTHKDITKNFRLEPVPKQPVVLPEIRYDLARWELKEQYQDSLMDLYMVLVNNPNFVIELRSHTDCRPFIGLTNDTLSQRRAQSVVDYLIQRGIEPERLLAKGYAERIPRTLNNDIEITYNGKPFLFKKGEVLDCNYIKFMNSKDKQEAAHQLNRRTEFIILRTDYVSKTLVENMVSASYTTPSGETIINLVKDPVVEAKEEPKIVHRENEIPVTMIQSNKGELECIVNGSKMTMLYSDDKNKDAIAISWEDAMTFIYQKRITKEDFVDRDNAFDSEGNIIDKSILILNNIQIGVKRIYKIEAVVLKDASHSIMMNKNGLIEFGEYEFDRQRGSLIFKE